MKQGSSDLAGPQRRGAAQNPLCDPFGRAVNDLRIAVTPDCPLRCWFCHREGMAPDGRRLTPHELRVLGRIAARLGIRHVKLTGGEPLLRRDLPEIIRHLAPLFGEVSLVTNGQFLENQAHELRAAGLTRINVSLHTLDAGVYHSLTGAQVEPVLRGIRAARDAGLHPVKVNVVATRQTLEGLDALLAWGEAERVTLQLIELHAPPGTPRDVATQHVSLEPVERELERRAAAVTRHALHGRPRYHFANSFAVEVTRPQGNASFCAACTRLRLTHDGFLKPCLMRADNHLDILGPLRAGVPESELEGIFRAATRRRAPFWDVDPPTEPVARSIPL